MHLNEDRKYILLAPTVNFNDKYNGISIRIKSWQIIFPELTIYDKNSKIKPQVFNHGGNKNISLTVDVCGYKSIDIIKTWFKYRKLKPNCYAQDSQLRFFYTQLIFYYNLVSNILIV